MTVLEFKPKKEEPPPPENRRCTACGFLTADEKCGNCGARAGETVRQTPERVFFP